MWVRPLSSNLVAKVPKPGEYAAYVTLLMGSTHSSLSISSL
jgi:hypothetical protein